MSKENPFRQLLRRALDGDRDAQAELYIEYGPHMRRVIKMKLRDLRIEWAVDPEDVFDSFFIRLIRDGTLKGIEDAYHFTNYVEKSVRNKSQQILRKVIRRKAIGLDQFPSDMFEDFHAQEDVEACAWEEQLEQAYSRLGHHERMICWLAGGGQTWQQIGARLNLSPDAARMIHRRAEARTRSEFLGIDARSTAEN